LGEEGGVVRAFEGRGCVGTHSAVGVRGWEGPCENEGAGYAGGEGRCDGDGVGVSVGMESREDQEKEGE
jgi:hypothetical protein